MLLTAHETALHRPMGAMIHALRDLGVDIEDGGSWSLPFTIRGLGHIRGGRIEIDASASSQFVSGLLLAAPRFDVGLHLVHTGDRLPSMPHIDMTVEALTRRGIKVQRPAAGEWVVEAGVPRALETAIEPDLSNAAPFLAAALVTGGQVSIGGWPAHSTQPGALLPGLLSALGARDRAASATSSPCAAPAPSAARSSTSPPAGELAPTFVGLAALADGPDHPHRHRSHPAARDGPDRGAGRQPARARRRRRRSSPTGSGSSPLPCTAASGRRTTTTAWRRPAR